MRLGTSSPLAHTGSTDWALKHAGLGLQAINFHLTCEDDPELVDEYAAEAEKLGLVMAEVGIWRNVMDPDEEARRKAIRYSIGQLELADRIGARCCVNIFGAAGPRWDGAYKENYSRETWDKGVSTIREIIDAVQPKNTYFTIESMPWMYPDGPDSYLELLEAVDRDQFAVHLDILNWMTTPKRYFFHREFISECFEKLGPHIRSCHLKNVRLEEPYTIHFRETCPEDGNIDLHYLINEGMKQDEEMTFIVEHLHTDEEYLKSVSYVKRIMGELGAANEK